MKPESGARPYPEVAALAARVASLRGLSTILDVGCSWTPEMALLHPDLAVVGVGRWGAGAGRRSPGFPFRYCVDLAADPGPSALSRLDPSRTALMLTGPTNSLPDLAGALTLLEGVVREAPVTIAATTTPEPVLAFLAKAGVEPSFAGRTRAGEQDEESAARLLVVDRSLADPGPVPGEFRVVAIMTTYNEEDVVGPCIGKLVADGIGVYLIDNWSSDGTYAIAEKFRGRGLVGLERFPDAPTDRFGLRALLRRVEEVAAGLEADWFIHHDADERRCGPWPGVGLREALWRVDRTGFSAVDHTVLNFRPIDDGFPPGGDFEAYLRHFEFGRTSDLLLQVKAWKKIRRVDLASHAGHEARFPGRRLFPYKFELKHYPIRSQSHGERKVFRERVARWDPNERKLGWHVHYDDVIPAQSFLRVPGELIEDRGAETRARYLAEFLAGAGLADYSFPAWALGGWSGIRLYRAVERLARSGPYRLLRRIPSGVARRVRRLPAMLARRRRHDGR